MFLKHIFTKNLHIELEELYFHFSVLTSGTASGSNVLTKDSMKEQRLLVQTAKKVNTNVTVQIYYINRPFIQGSRLSKVLKAITTEEPELYRN